MNKWYTCLIATLLVALPDSRLFSMERLKTKVESTKDRREAAVVEGEIRRRVLVDELAPRRAESVVSLLKVPYIDWKKVIIRVGPILAEYFAQQEDKAENVTADQSSADELITAVIDCIKFKNVPLREIVQKKSETGGDEVKLQLVELELFATDVFNEVRLKQFLTNFLIEVKNFWIAVKDGAVDKKIGEKTDGTLTSDSALPGFDISLPDFDINLPGFDELNRIATLFEKTKEQWVLKKHQLVIHYYALIQSVDPGKIAQLERAHGKIVLTAYFDNIKAILENYLGISPADPKQKRELKLSVIPIIGEYLEKFLHAEAFFDLFSLFNNVDNIDIAKLTEEEINDRAELKKQKIIEKALSCIKFNVLFPVIKDEKGKEDEDAQRVRITREEGCRVLLKLLVEMHSNREKSVSSAVNQLLFILGEHSIEEKQKQANEAAKKSVLAAAVFPAVSSSVNNNNNAPAASINPFWQ